MEPPSGARRGGRRPQLEVLSELDILVVGSGVAGLSAVVAAAAAAPGVRIGIVSKGELSDSATQWAQGGVAAVLHRSEAEGHGPGDSHHLHVADTMSAGAGLCDPDAVETLVAEGPARLRDLVALGAVFDRNEAGKWDLALEGGHSTARVVHAGGAATGAEVERTLVNAARGVAGSIWEHAHARELIVEGGRCRGIRATTAEARDLEIRAAATLLATGGAGQLFPVTTNPLQATGDGLAMALRAGVAVADVEFVQFHPTALHGPTGPGPRPLMSEALRGEGALLRDQAGRRFVDELQPRDIVAAAVAAAIARSDLDHVWLDATPVEDFAKRFPSLAAGLLAVGIDPQRDWIPVAPAAHYMCGGVLTDLDAATTLPGLWAAGEVACTGVHGANRLASNSLLEGLVFGTRAAEAIIGEKVGPAPTGALGPLLDPAAGGRGLPVEQLPRSVPVAAARVGQLADRRASLQRTMNEGAGVVRSASSLEQAAKELDVLAATGPDGEDANLLVVGRALLTAARARRESRGGHRRADHPETSPDLTKRLALC